MSRSPELLALEDRLWVINNAAQSGALAGAEMSEGGTDLTALIGRFEQIAQIAKGGEIPPGFGVALKLKAYRDVADTLQHVLSFAGGRPPPSAWKAANTALRKLREMERQS